MAWSAPELNIDRLYAAVGHAISHWELMELELARLYSVFTKRPDQLAAIVEFGTGSEASISTKRLTKLKGAGKRYFMAALCDQEGEHALRDLVAEVKATLLTRHQIAHGIAWGVLTTEDREYKSGEWVETVIGYLWTAPWYAGHRLRGQGDAYGYNSQDLDGFAARFAQLRERASALGHRLAPRS